MKAERVDAVVVGSGVSASIMAAKLAKAGKQVIMLESGPPRSMADLVSSQIWARRNKWGGAPVINSGSNTLGVGFNSGWGSGGSGMHHYAVWLRLHPEDFQVRTQFGRGLDWPISYEDLQPYYDQIQSEVGISGDAKAEIWRPPGAPYPMPPLQQSAQGRIISRGFAKLGMHTAPIPLAINSVEYNGRPACIYDGWCDAGCPTGALANPLATYLSEALTQGAILKNRCTVTEIVQEGRGDRVVGVNYIDEKGSVQTQYGDLVILSAFAINNPRLLLASANSKHPHGLANRSGLVGKYLMSHPSRTLFGLFDEETESHLGVNAGQIMCQDNYAKSINKPGFGSYQWLAANAVKPNDLLGIANSRPDIIGNKLHAFMQDAAKHFATMVAVVEDQAVRENHLSLSRTKDKYNMPAPEINYTVHPDSLKLWESMQDEGKRVFKAAGARETWAGGIGPMHIMGGTIMGKDGEQSVTNEHGQCHDIPNLIITGPGLFPSSGGVNPTFTISALTLRSAEYLLKNWRSLSTA